LIGTGPYVLKNYTPSVGMTFERFPDYWDKEFSFLDQIEAPFVLEYANGLAQLKAGNIYTWAVRGEDIISVKKDIPALGLYTNEPSGFSGAGLQFGFSPAG